MSDEKKQVITKEKQDAVTLRWLQMATDASKSRGYSRKSDYERPVLSGLHVKNGRTESADGFRIHISPTPEPLSELDDTIIRIRDGKALHKTPGRVYEAEEVEGNFPDTRAIDPDSGNHQPQAVIAVKAKYLREALEMPNNNPSGAVVLRIHDSDSPMTVTSGDGKSKAIVMPISVKKGHFGDKIAHEAEQADNDFKALRELAGLVLRMDWQDDLSLEERWEKVVKEADKALANEGSKNGNA